MTSRVARLFQKAEEWMVTTSKSELSDGVAILKDEWEKKEKSHEYPYEHRARFVTRWRTAHLAAQC